MLGYSDEYRALRRCHNTQKRLVCRNLVWHCDCGTQCDAEYLWQTVIRKSSD